MAIAGTGAAWSAPRPSSRCTSGQGAHRRQPALGLHRRSDGIPGARQTCRGTCTLCSLAQTPTHQPAGPRRHGGCTALPLPGKGTSTTRCSPPCRLHPHPDHGSCPQLPRRARVPLPHDLLQNKGSQFCGQARRPEHLKGSPNQPGRGQQRLRERRPSLLHARVVSRCRRRRHAPPPGCSVAKRGLVGLSLVPRTQLASGPAQQHADGLPLLPPHREQEGPPQPINHALPRHPTAGILGQLHPPLKESDEAGQRLGSGAAKHASLWRGLQGHDHVHGARVSGH